VRAGEGFRRKVASQKENEKEKNTTLPNYPIARDLVNGATMMMMMRRMIMTMARSRAIAEMTMMMIIIIKIITRMIMNVMTRDAAAVEDIVTNPNVKTNDGVVPVFPTTKRDTTIDPILKVQIDDDHDHPSLMTGVRIDSMITCTTIDTMKGILLKDVSMGMMKNDPIDIPIPIIILPLMVREM
jgi:hypothetical protein